MKKVNRVQHILQQVRAALAEKPVAEQQKIKAERCQALFADVHARACCVSYENHLAGVKTGRKG
jgi:hypothetical protein